MKHLIDIGDFSCEEIDALLKLGCDIMDNPERYAQAASGRILGTLFFEPSTRTRLSFTSAMMSLGGNVLGFSSAQSSSTTKGETLADTIRMVSAYTDIIAMRHPNEGAPIVAESVASVPVINAGDGGHFHPTQTLTDLLTIYRRFGRLDGLTVGLCGDLKYGRTVHSLVAAMSRYTGVKFYFIAPSALKMPDYVKNEHLKDTPFVECESIEEAIEHLDILYMTRVQQERFADKAEYERLRDCYILDSKKMALGKDGMIVLHPLPRVNEIATEVDSDPRAMYFEQARCGRYVRMALILTLLSDALCAPSSRRCDVGEINAQRRCKNPVCISVTDRAVPARFRNGGTGSCIYCDKD